MITAVSSIVLLRSKDVLETCICYDSRFDLKDQFTEPKRLLFLPKVIPFLAQCACAL